MPKSEQSPSPEDIIKEGKKEAEEGFEEYAQKTVWEKMLKEAQRKRQKVQIYVTGNYKPVMGYVTEIKHGVVFLDTPISKDAVVTKKIYWIQVFKPDVEEK